MGTGNVRHKALDSICNNICCCYVRKSENGDIGISNNYVSDVGVEIYAYLLFFPLAAHVIALSEIETKNWIFQFDSIWSYLRLRQGVDNLGNKYIHFFYSSIKLWKTVSRIKY